MTDLPQRNGNVVPLQAYADRLPALEAENADLRAALESRIVIEQARDAISVRIGTTPEIAFEMLQGLARTQRRELHEYAAAVVESRGLLGA